MKRKIIYGQLRFLLLNVATAAAALPNGACGPHANVLQVSPKIDDACRCCCWAGQRTVQESAGIAAGLEHNKSSEARHIKLTTKSLLASHWLRSGQGK